jgi:hypothetical protein
METGQKSVEKMGDFDHKDRSDVTRCLATCFNVTFSIENHVYKDLE